MRIERCALGSSSSSSTRAESASVLGHVLQRSLPAPRVDLDQGGSRRARRDFTVPRSATARVRSLRKTFLPPRATTIFPGARRQPLQARFQLPHFLRGPRLALRIGPGAGRVEAILQRHELDQLAPPQASSAVLFAMRNSQVRNCASGCHCGSACQALTKASCVSSSASSCDPSMRAR